MNHTMKPLEELNVLDDFMITAITGDPDVGVPFCRTLLSVLLQKKIEKIRIVSQRTLPALTPELRGIRMDVEIEELREEKGCLPVMSIYDLEPHLQNDLNFPRHNRFYQAKIDSRYLRRGETDFSKLPDLYVLTITNFDPFGRDYMLYRFENRCRELPGLEYDDGLHFLYFNTEGNNGGTPEIREMLTYLKESTQNNATNAAIQEIHRYVTDVKIKPEVKSEYMTFEEFIYLKEKRAAKEAAEETAREVTEAVTKETMVQDILDLLEEYGKIPDEIRERLRKEETPALKKWHKIAARVKSLQDFMDQLNHSDEGI